MTGRVDVQGVRFMQIYLYEYCILAYIYIVCILENAYIYIDILRTAQDRPWGFVYTCFQKQPDQPSDFAEGVLTSILRHLSPAGV